MGSHRAAFRRVAVFVFHTGRWLVILPAFGLLQLTRLPLTQAWNGVTLYRARLADVLRIISDKPGFTFSGIFFKNG